MYIQKWLLWASALCLILSFSVAGSESQSAPTIVNIMIDYDTPAHPTSDQLSASREKFDAIIQELYNRNLNATTYLTTEVTSTSERLVLTMTGSNPKFEYALGGNNSGEMLSTMSYSEQKALLAMMKEWVDLAHYCGINTRDARGFKPQLFDQNEDTFRVLDEMNMDYDAGFKAGVLYLPGHEVDVWPYPVEGHNFYAVPVSTYDLNGEKVYLSDKYIKTEKHQSATEWSDLLISKFDQAAASGEPVVAIFSISVSGSGEYLGAFKRFLNYAVSKNAKFVTTMELVDLTKEGGLSSLSQVPSSPSPANLTINTSCSFCDSLKKGGLNVIAHRANYTVENGSKVVSLTNPNFNEAPRN
ncbi:MAG TPA: hypothetical protein VN455_00605 [Methanotrichaceae archaeon]|nr:hypothetical protein [Methanotrichaceae archaeon]